MRETDIAQCPSAQWHPQPIAYLSVSFPLSLKKNFSLFFISLQQKKTGKNKAAELSATYRAKNINIHAYLCAPTYDMVFGYINVFGMLIIMIISMQGRQLRFFLLRSSHHCDYREEGDCRMENFFRGKDRFFGDVFGSVAGLELE